MHGSSSREGVERSQETQDGPIRWAPQFPGQELHDSHGEKIGVNMCELCTQVVALEDRWDHGPGFAHIPCALGAAEEAAKRGVDVVSISRPPYRRRKANLGVILESLAGRVGRGTEDAAMLHDRVLAARRISLELGCGSTADRPDFVSQPSFPWNVNDPSFVEANDPDYQCYYCGLQAAFGRRSGIIDDDILVQSRCGQGGMVHPSCMLKRATTLAEGREEPLP